MILPLGWRRANIRRFATMKTGHTPARSVDEYWSDTTIPWFTLADVWQLRDGTKVFLGETAGMISELGLANSAAELLPAGTVVLSRTASVGFCGIMPQPMATSQDFWNWVCGPDLLPEFLNYQFKSMADDLRTLTMGSTHKTIYQKDAAGIEIVVPPLSEQRAIADYLDRETAKIDLLITKQKQLITTLRERRAAIEVEAFAGYPTSPLSRLIVDARPLTYGIVQAGENSPDGVRYIGPSDMHDHSGVPDPRRLRRTTHEIAAQYTRSAVSGGDIIVSIGPAFGKTMLVPQELSGVNLTQDTARVACRPDLVRTAYALRVLRSRIASDYWDEQIAGATFRRLNLNTLGRTPIPLAPLSEQDQIVARLDDKIQKIDDLLAKTARFIELSKERRAALITAAVTGQIDVTRRAA